MHPERDTSQLALGPAQLLLRPRRETRAGVASGASRVSAGAPRIARALRPSSRGARRRRPRRASARASRRGARSRATAAMKPASSPGTTSRPLTPSTTCSAGGSAIERHHRQARGERFHDDVAEGVGETRKEEHVGRGVVRGELGAALHADEARFGMGRLEPARAGPSPTTTIRVPGRSARARSKARRPSSTFFSAATRPTISSTGAVAGLPLAAQRGAAQRRREALAIDAAADDRQVVKAGGGSSARAARRHEGARA